MRASSFRQLKLASERATKVLYEFLIASVDLRYSARTLTPEIRRFLDATDELLSSAATKQNPPSSALECVRAALNKKVRRLAYDTGWIVDRDPMRHIAETLIEYLKLIATCGPIHTACRREGCNQIVFGGRGNKRFCSAKCRVEFWGYKRQKQYFVERQRANRKVHREMKTKKEK